MVCDPRDVDIGGFACLYMLCLVGCLLAQGLDCLEIIDVLDVRNQRKRRRVKFIRSQLYVRCSN